MNVGMNMIGTIMGASVVTSSIIGWNITNRVRADMAAIEKIIKVEEWGLMNFSRNIKNLEQLKKLTSISNLQKKMILNFL